MKELSKAYEPQKYEDEIYKKWMDSGFFNPDTCVEKGVCKDDSPTFSMVLPPPNVTGTLHIGHASMLAIEDLVTRYKRMQGFKTLWLPGTDHAAIATQAKVEKLLIEKGIKEPKKELGREKFLAEVEKFAQESHDTIVNQCKKMGSSLDWSREAFTLDVERNLAVRTVFKKMYDDGLIYRGLRLVNWCPHCKSTLADDEVEHKDQIAKLYTFKYSKDFPIAIATTRPETKLGDTAVAVNSNDKRYAKYIGQEFVIKNFAGGADLKIKIIGEESVDMKFGTGAVGVTPAHSAIDYEMAQKNNLPIVKIINEEGQMTKEAGEKYLGKAVKVARAEVVEWLKENNLLEKEEEVPNSLSICYRCGYAIEPLPSKQWFIGVNKEFVLPHSNIDGIQSGEKVTLKKLMQKVVTNKQIEIIPDRFEKTYFHWIDNLRDWCISRQLWYGHRIPVWYKGEEVYSGIDAPTSEGWSQDPDTLDTWFSAGLWSFSTLGWPNQTKDLKDFHPTTLLETGYDIIFFWVARMILMTTYTLGTIPFETVYLHGLVRDEKGRKMSKSLGNVINPLDTISKFGADATRLSLLLGNTPGNDLKLSEEKVEGFRNFTNKLWNISRFMLLNIPEPKIDVKLPELKTLSDKWIIGCLSKVVMDASTMIENYQLSAAGEKLREFTWGDLADWYLEIAKVEGGKEEILNYILNTVLKLWHPFMPFVTEQIWSEIYGGQRMLIVEKWPKQESITENTIEFETIRNIVTGIRTLRADNKIEPIKKLDATISAGAKLNLIKENSEVIKALARLGNLDIVESAKKSSTAAGFVEGGVEVFIELAGAIDLDKEKERLQKEFETLTKYINGIENKLANEEFVRNAPPAVIEKERQKLAEAQVKLDKIEAQL
ncbi:MAG: valine--tRNA ligase [Candidatus Magasanikbacteria bacterium]